MMRVSFNSRSTPAPRVGSARRGKRAVGATCARESGASRAPARRVVCRANYDDLGINLDEYCRAELKQVCMAGVKIPVALIRLHNETNQIMPIYMGDLEASALAQEMHKRTTSRPMTHDLSRDLLDIAGYKVRLTAINRLVGNTYHSRMFLQSHDGKHTWDVDARPSDSINFALRFSAPIFVHNTIAAKMAIANGGSFSLGREAGLHNENESHQAIIESCRAECGMHTDPYVVERMRMDLAVAQERYQDAIELREKIERGMRRDMTMRLIVNIEAALADHRFEEAARMRDELEARRLAQTDKWRIAPEQS